MRLRPSTLASVACLALAACAHEPGAAAPAPSPELKSPFTGFSSAHYRDPSAWLCLPGRAGDPCQANLDSTELRADGTRAVVPEPLPAAPLPVDCFYVYPTMDMSPGAANHTDFTHLERMIEVTQAQAAHFRGVCNLYVPLYRQVTIGTYLRSADVREKYLAVASSDVDDAFLHYMGQYNQGRKVVLLGHSQGAEMVVRLLKRFFDNDPLMRERLLLALPIGGNIEVPRGKTTGGTFANLSLCTGADETGCVLGFRSVVAGSPGPSWDELPAGHVTACVNPTALGVPAHPTARTYLLLTERLRRHLHGSDDVTTPFIEVPGFYRAECVEGPAGVFSLAMSPVGAPGDTRVNPIDFDARLFHGEMGLHIVDLQLAQGDLIDLVARREKALPPRP